MKVDVLLDQDVLLQLSNNYSITSNLNILRTARYMCPSVRYPGTVRFPGFFCWVEIYERAEKNNEQYRKTVAGRVS